ncbi:MAG: GGDEF domain-containing protein [Chloroflexi bacterium]|nr:GGDEF domain-containing protein [Chloroflexota bacterium]
MLDSLRSPDAVMLVNPDGTIGAVNHAVGDQVLQALAARFRDNVRDIDLLARYGGEEFVALLPEVGWESARVAAERLRQSVAETPIETASGPLNVTVSLGVASAAPDCPDLPTLLRLADEALYTAKAAGRNRVGESGQGGEKLSS